MRKPVRLPRLCLVILSGLFAIFGVTSANAQVTPISIPYSNVYQNVAKLRSNLSNFGLLAVELKFSSQICGIVPADIALRVQTSDGNESPLSLDRYGFTQLPHVGKTDIAGAKIVSNQASGLTYHAKIVIIPPTSSDTNFAWIDNVLKQITSALKKTSPLPSFLLPDVTGIALLYSKPDTSVEVKVPGNPIVMDSQPADGFLGLPADTWIIKLYQNKSLAKSNPAVELHGLPNKVEPLFDPDIEAAMNKKIMKDKRDCQRAPAQ